GADVGREMDDLLRIEGLGDRGRIGRDNAGDGLDFDGLRNIADLKSRVYTQSLSRGEGQIGGVEDAEARAGDGDRVRAGFDVLEFVNAAIVGGPSRGIFSPVLVRRTEAPLMTPPEGSFTPPSTTPKVDCACAHVQRNPVTSTIRLSTCAVY